MIIENPLLQFTDNNATPLNFGYVYIGEVNKNPETFPIETYWDDAYTIPAQQPLRTMNGYIVRNGSVSSVYSRIDYSISVKNKDGVLIYGLADSSKFNNTISRLSEPDGSSLVGFTHQGTNAVATTVESVLRERVSVKSFGGAVGDGVTDDTVAIQKTVDAVVSAGGGVVYFPAAPLGYKITSTILVDVSAITTLYQNRILFVGDGPSVSWLKCVGSGGVWYKGNASNFASYVLFQGIRFTGDKASGGKGIQASIAGYLTMDRVVLENFDYGFDATDVEQSAFYNTNFQYNNHGIFAHQATTVTSPNSWSFYNCGVNGNKVWGGYIKNANAFYFNGGSVQGNGFIGGGATQFGWEFDEAGDGYGNVKFSGTCFESNGGLGDIVSIQTTNPVVMTLDSVSFIRNPVVAALISGAANNGAGLIRLTIPNTAILGGLSVVSIYGVVGTTEANSATPWPFTIIDATHIDLTGSAFVNAYVSGGKVAYLGFSTSNIWTDGTNANSIYAIRGCTFRFFNGYLESALRPTIRFSANAKFADDGSNYFQSVTEKVLPPQIQKIGDDGSDWQAYTPTAVAAGGTFTATATGKYKRIGKTIYVEGVVTTTAYAATPTAPLTVSLPITAVSAAVATGMNQASLTSATGSIAAATATARFWRYDGTFPISANAQQFYFSAVYEG